MLAGEGVPLTAVPMLAGWTVVLGGVHSGLRVVDPTLADESLSLGESPLTGRERDVLAATNRRRNRRQIAARLFLSEGMVRNHLSSVIGKTGARTRSDAVRIATERGWI